MGDVIQLQPGYLMLVHEPTDPSEQVLHFKIGDNAMINTKLTKYLLSY